MVQAKQGIFVQIPVVVSLGASSSTTKPEPVVLITADIPEAELSLPYKANQEPALKWWILPKNQGSF